MSPPGALVRPGPKQLQKSHKGSRRNEQGQLPTTSRALVLRNGKEGARGTGELFAITKISGREKLDLLAEDLTKRSQRAIIRRFNISESLKICESQSNSFLDDICRLKDSSLFYPTILSELKARTTAGQEVDLSPSHVADVVSTRIHNSFMLASAWHIAFKYLNDLRIDGLQDSAVERQLLNNQDLRQRYLVVSHLVNELLELSQARVATLATTTPHYASYFKKKGKSDEVEFDWQKLKEAGRSFMDSIILEICFPRAPYSYAVLFEILHDAIDESPRESKRFSQALFDAIGDLAIVVQVQQMLDAPLLSLQGQEWYAQKPEYPDDFKDWLRAQELSEVASDKYELFKHLIYPLHRAKETEALQNMWRVIDASYKRVAGMDIETLWQLPSAFEVRSSWTAVYQKPSHDDRRGNADSSDEDDQLPALSPSRRKKKPLALTRGGDNDDSDGSMPGLQSVSNSDEEEDDWDTSDEEEKKEEEEEDSDNGSEYDSDFEDEMRDFFREAMDTIHEMDVLHGTPIDPLETEDRKGNPFLKILGSLRGRMFSSKAKLKTRISTKPQPGQAASQPFPSTLPKPAPSTASPGPRSVSIDEVEDEHEHEGETVSKKKKKKKKKSKKPNLDSVQETTATSPPPTSPPPPKTLPAKKAPEVAAAEYVPPYMSTTSLGTASTAQSARSYLHSEKLDDSKDKVKTRGGHASVFSSSTHLFTRLTSREKNKSTVEKEKKARQGWFKQISKRAVTTMEQLFHLDENKVKPMKWDHFLKLMTEMGFSINPSTAGSRVRFDPPDPADKSITVHKPHPHSELPPHTVLEIGKQLQRYYGWSKEDLKVLQGKR